MLSLFKRRSATKNEPTFKMRVEQFWGWYAKVAPRFFETIEAKQCSSLVGEVSPKVNEILPGFAWVFGPGEGGRGHSFTLSGEGNPHRQLLTIFWHSQAPNLTGWTFYPARQPGDIDGKHIRVGDQEFNPIEFWLTPSIDRENEDVDIAVWHPLFNVMEEGTRWTVLFLFLDEVLGEYGTQQRIGEIKLENNRLAESIPLKELKPFLQIAERDNNWKNHIPGEMWTAYTFKNPSTDFLRADIIAGATTHMALVDEYAKAQGSMSDPIAGSGADFIFVAFNSAFLPEGRQSEARGEIEDAVGNALAENASGRLLGGAFGTRNAYIDILLFDGDSSLGIVKQTLIKRGLPPGTSINFFAKEKRGHRLQL